jgi:hypothetical protein
MFSIQLNHTGESDCTLAVICKNGIPLHQDSTPTSTEIFDFSESLRPLGGTFHHPVILSGPQLMVAVALLKYKNSIPCLAVYYPPSRGAFMVHSTDKRWVVGDFIHVSNE